MAGAADRHHAMAGATASPLAADRFEALRVRALALPPPLIGLAVAGVALAAHVALWGAVAPWGRAGTAGALLAAAGFAWAMWAWAMFRAARTPAGLADTPLQLIEEGPYRFGRNPMYLGVAVMLLGAATGLGVPLLAVSALLFGAIVNTVHVPHEEAQMARRFGGWYRDYTSARRRWI